MAEEGSAMKLRWYQRNQEVVAKALEEGARPDMATTMASGPLDELVALHDELGVFAALDALVRGENATASTIGCC